MSIWKIQELGGEKKNPQDTRLRRVVRLTQSTGQTLLLSLNRDLTYHHQRASGRTGAGYYHWEWASKHHTATVSLKTLASEMWWTAPRDIGEESALQFTTLLPLSHDFQDSCWGVVVSWCLHALASLQEEEKWGRRTTMPTQEKGWCWWA